MLTSIHQLENNQYTTRILIVFFGFLASDFLIFLVSYYYELKRVCGIKKKISSYKWITDRKERLVAELLTRFKNLATLACSPTEKGASKEVAAAQAFQMEVESTALLTMTNIIPLTWESLQVRATEDLHRLVRELKEMWLFGTLKETDEGKNESTIDDDSAKVGELLNGLIEKMKNSRFNYLDVNDK
ncbi:hypothetical protein HI914_06408 [Erysiphe necator]|nr:hypothetical protein HI914_06408 [Erysiphe necator]